MNYDNLHELINRYTADFDHINNEEHDEKFKWRAVKHFQNVWFSEAAKNMSFSELFKEAKKKCKVLIDGSAVAPASGIVKLAEKEPEKVERLFRDVLFADDTGNIAVRQQNMEQFLNDIEVLREEYFIKNYKYKQDRHSASCYLILFAPEQNFIYRHTNALKFAKYVEFDRDIGYGSSFSLENYYILCELVVKALREHDDLLEKHFNLINDGYYHDNSLHIMASDLIYCARCYGYYTGLVCTSYDKNRKHPKINKEEEIAIRKKQIDSLENDIQEQEKICMQYEDISLVNVEVSSSEYGNGLVVHHEDAFITVKFLNFEKKYEINRKYTNRPTFENDTEIVNALSEYADAKRRIKDLLAKLTQLREKEY